MKSKIVFSLLLIGCAGTDGNFPISAVLVLISLFILLIESKKKDVPPASKARLK